MPFVSGYFTIERYLIGLTPQEMETKLGFRPGYLRRGATIIVLDREPLSSEFMQRGSTRFSDGHGLDRRALHETKFLPGAWLGERLVKVKPVLDAIEPDFPDSPTAVEQWRLRRGANVTGQVVCTLSYNEKYWRAD